MGKYNGAVITAAGQNLIAQAIAESKTVTFTTAQASSHVYPSSTDFEALTALTDVESTVNINYAGVYSDTVVQVSARFDNDGVETAYLINTLGFFAQLGTDTPILFAVSTAVTPDQMPVFDADNPSAFIYNMQITVQNADSVTVTVNPAGTVTIGQLDIITNDIYGKIGDLTDLTTDNKASAVAAINEVNDKTKYKILQRGTAYSVDDFVLCKNANDALIFVCTTAGTTAVMEPETYTTVTSGNTVTDGTAVFTAYSVKAAIIDGKAPKSHASTATTYGVGNASRYGHVKLSDDYNTISASQKAANGVGASAWALQTVRSFIGTLSNLLTDAKTNLVAAINEVDGHADAAQASANIVQAQVSNSDDAYDPTTPYEVGELCIYNNVLYRCTTACSAGSWDTNQSCFTADTLVNVHNKPKIQYFSANDFTLTGDWTFFSTSLPYFSVKIINDHIVNVNITISSDTGLANGTRLSFPNFLPAQLNTSTVIQGCCTTMTISGSFMDKQCNYFLINRQFSVDNYSGSTIKAITLSVVYII